MAVSSQDQILVKKNHNYILFSFPLKLDVSNCKSYSKHLSLEKQLKIHPLCYIAIPCTSVYVYCNAVFTAASWCFAIKFYSSNKYNGTEKALLQSSMRWTVLQGNAVSMWEMQDKLLQEFAQVLKPSSHLFNSNSRSNLKASLLHKSKYIVSRCLTCVKSIFNALEQGKLRHNNRKFLHSLSSNCKDKKRSKATNVEEKRPGLKAFTMSFFITTFITL